MIITAVLTATISASGSAQASCYADYKAKRDNPLRLHYGIVELSNNICNVPQKVLSNVTERLDIEDWQLLNILSVFDEAGLKKRQESAGKYYLRY